MTHLLLVEDDPAIRTSLARAMRDEGYEVTEAADGQSALSALGAGSLDLVLLDLRLPDISGFEVCRQIRMESTLPIIIVTAQDDTHDLVAGLEAGADDYVVKPVEPKAIAARVRALLRRATTYGQPNSVKEFGGLEIRAVEGLVLRDGVDIGLTSTEFRMMCVFADHPGQVLSREQLLDLVWGYDYFGDSRLVDAHIRRLRLKIERVPDTPEIVVTARGLGYRLQLSP